MTKWNTNPRMENSITNPAMIDDSPFEKIIVSFSLNTNLQFSQLAPSSQQDKLSMLPIALQDLEE